jgi:divalent metal cation (Fe/Co/Zn/Cd) transporter
VLVPGDWTVQQGHDLLRQVEDEIRQALPATSVETHLEPLGDPSSLLDPD